MENKKKKQTSLPPLPYSWNTARGEDEYGSWIEFDIYGITQRMRLIKPGVFLMGSPHDEPERFDDEKQHEVELTRGFWLADTTCTQELWQAVMGNNQSEFRGSQCPVETVSYEDCLEFLETINDLVSDLKLRLPTEAEWEYSCRAGTETPFWFGESISKSQVNYSIFPSLNGGKNNFKVSFDQLWGTVKVKDQPLNGWGLYQMHGNVREWCSDWYGPYESSTAVDPLGPLSGDSRILRGGSWYSRIRGCRSAARIARRPYMKEDNYGFRFCRDQ